MRHYSLYIPTFLVVALAMSIPAHGFAGIPLHSPPTSEVRTLASCEDMANRQIELAEKQLRQNSYGRALRVLNRAAENCDIPEVREKIVEVLNQWYSSIRPQRGTSSLRQFITVVSNHPYVSSNQKERFNERIEASIHQLIRHRYQSDDLRAAYGVCQSFSNYVEDTFELKYYCGTAATEVGALDAATRSHEWMWENWSDDQSLIEREELASRLEKLYLQGTQFEKAYELSKEIALREASPENILTSLVSIRGIFLEPLLHVGSTYYDLRLTSTTRDYVRKEFKRINFPTFIESFYVLSESGETNTILYGEDQVDPPSPSLLDQASGPSSLLQDSDSRAWLVSATSEGYLALQFGRQTSPEENVHLESLLENIDSDEAWQDLYDLEFSETYPAIGSAVATLVSGAYLGDLNMDPFRETFDATPALMYYCLQNESGNVTISHAFSKSNLGYGTGGWQRTSNTPALFHHTVEYDGETIREVVWPTYDDEKWTGVTRVGIARR